MKTLKICLLASVLVVVQSFQILAQSRVSTKLKQDTVTESTATAPAKPVKQTITWYSQSDDEIKVLDLRSPNFSEEFNQMVDEMDRMYHNPEVEIKKPALEQDSAHGTLILKPYIVKGEF